MRKQIQFQSAEGTVKVNFYLTHNGSTSSIGDIHVHTTFSSKLPTRPTIEWHMGRCKLAQTYYRENNGEIIRYIDYLDTPIANEIVTEILRIKAKETPELGGYWAPN